MAPDPASGHLAPRGWGCTQSHRLRTRSRESAPRRTTPGSQAATDAPDPAAGHLAPRGWGCTQSHTLTRVSMASAIRPRMPVCLPSTTAAGPRSPAKAVRVELKAGFRGEPVGDGPGVAGHDRGFVVDLLDEHRQGAGDAGRGGPVELDGDRGASVGDGSGQPADDGLPGDGAVLIIVAEVGVELA